MMEFQKYWASDSTGTEKKKGNFYRLKKGMEEINRDLAHQNDQPFSATLIWMETPLGLSPGSYIWCCLPTVQDPSSHTQELSFQLLYLCSCLSFGREMFFLTHFLKYRPIHSLSSISTQPLRARGGAVWNTRKKKRQRCKCNSQMGRKR